jgi:hypothetical protein
MNIHGTLGTASSAHSSAVTEAVGVAQQLLVLTRIHRHSRRRRFLGQLGVHLLVLRIRTDHAARAEAAAARRPVALAAHVAKAAAGAWIHVGVLAYKAVRPR